MIRGVCKLRDKDASGSILVAVVLLTASMSLILGGLTSVSIQRTRIMRAENDRIRAMVIAEAGIGVFSGMLADDPSLAASTNPVASNSDFAGGSYEIHVDTPIPNVLLVTSQGVYREQQATVAVTLHIEEVDPENIPGSIMGPFGDLMLLAGQNLTLSGGAQVGLGAYGAHANGNVTLSGGPNLSAHYLSASGAMTCSGNPQIHLNGGAGHAHANGLVTLRGMINAATISSSDRINGNWGTNTSATNTAPVVVWPNWFNPLPPVALQPVATVPTVDLPELDDEAFLTHAQENDYYYNGNQTINRSWLTSDILRRTGVNVNNSETIVAPQGGVLYVNGNVSIASDMRVEGMVIATGNITIGGAATINNITPYPGLVSIDGNIVLGGGANGPTVNGWIYAMNGNVTAGGGASGCGIVAAQNVTVTAGYEIGDFEGIPFMWPGRENGGSQTNGAAVALIAWTR